MPEATIVIPTYNRKATLMLALEALAQQSVSPERFEVVVVSDGSTDGTSQAVSALRMPYRLRLLEQTNSGPSAARNLGAKAACGDLIIYVDDDIEPAPAFVEHHLRRQEGEEFLVLIGPQAMPAGERCDCWVEWEHRMLQRQYDRFVSGEWEVKPGNLYSGNFSVLRKHLIAVGGFDEGMFRQEDVDLGFRLAALGLRFAFEPQAVGYHRPTRTFKSWYHSPYIYGKRDVQIARDKGQHQLMEMARYHYRQRNRVTRALARVTLGRGYLLSATLWALRSSIHTADRIGLRQVALGFCSITFNLRYLQGMAEELGGARRMWDALK